MARRPFRRTLIVASVALGTALAAAGGWKFARASAPLSGPIIIVSIDTLRADHLPAYGYRKIQTPAIDELAASGVVFERAYSHATQTLPAHIALLAGRLPFETGVRDDAGAGKPTGRLLPELLRDRGYSTAAVVSASLLRKQTGINQGFDFFDDEMPANPEEPSAEVGQRDGTESEKIAEHWLDTSGTSRAFLFLHLNEPHKPYAPPDRFSQYSPYDGEIAYADEIVGRLIHYLKTHQLYDRSTIVLLSDHGEGLGDHGEQEHGLFVYDEAIHVPLIIKQESNVNAGRRVVDLVQQVDMVPTILDLVKAPVPGSLHGRSLKPLLDGTGHLRERPIYSEAVYGRYHFGWSGLTSIIDGHRQYIKGVDEELYDLTRDRFERENLAGPNAETKEAADALRSFGSADVQSNVLAADPRDKREIVERYRAALELANDRKWNDAIGLLQHVLRDEPDAAEGWSELADVSRAANRYDVALDAYRHIIVLQPSDPAGYLGAADVLLKERKLEDARARATEAATVAPDKDTRSRATAHTLLARVAIARREPDVAREEAALAFEADPALPIQPFVEGRILYDQGKYKDAWIQFEQAVTASRKPGATPISDLHFFAADTLIRLNRPLDAETEFTNELRLFPQNLRARAGLATLYHTTGQTDAADVAITEMLHAAPTPESYATAARLLSSFGKLRQADSVRAQARRAFPLRRQ
jgi:arylsulfatase A-like enzyme/cytochrome c-type biogenesis protein CcmH/NrfG